jgi:hypothetical protein
MPQRLQRIVKRLQRIVDFEFGRGLQIGFLAGLP